MRQQVSALWLPSTIGFVQALALFVLLRFAQSGGGLWPAAAIRAAVFLVLLLVLLLVPLLVVQGRGRASAPVLRLWWTVASLLLAGLGAWHRLRGFRPGPGLAQPGVMHAALPSPLLAGAALFLVVLGQVLVLAGSRHHHLMAPYARCCAVAREMAREAGVSGIFIVALWLIVQLWARLFALVHLPWLRLNLCQPWFGIPLAGLATVLDLSWCRSRPERVGAVLRAALELIAWLLPLAVLATLLFLVRAVFVGLNGTLHRAGASARLLELAAALIVLINAGWQSGASTPRPLVRQAGDLAAALLLPLVGLAAYALLVRVEEHGFRVRRVLESGGLLVAAVIAAGYALALGRGLRLRRWLPGLGIVNIVAACSAAVVVLALGSPLADPARIVVASQLARLASGRVAPQRFRFSDLATQGGGFGHAALEHLAAEASGPQAGLIRQRAAAALRGEPMPRASLTAAQRAGQLRIYPRSYALAPGLVRQRWRKAAEVPPCLTELGPSCEVFPAELTGRPPDQLIVVWGGPVLWRTAVLGQERTGHWAVLGTLGGPICGGTLRALRAGLYAVVAPTLAYRTLETDGQDLNLQSRVRSRPACAPHGAGLAQHGAELR